MRRKQLFLPDEIIKKIDELKKNEGFNCSHWFATEFIKKFMLIEKIKKDEQELKEKLNKLNQEKKVAHEQSSYLTKKEKKFFDSFKNLGEPAFEHSQHIHYCKAIEWVSLEIFKNKIKLHQNHKSENQ